jgi:hypothetical protein
MCWSAISIATWSPRAQLAQEVPRHGARHRAQDAVAPSATAQDAVALAEAAVQVGLDRREHRRLGVDGEDRRTAR